MSFYLQQRPKKPSMANKKKNSCVPSMLIFLKLLQFLFISASHGVLGFWGFCPDFGVMKKEGKFQSLEVRLQVHTSHLKI